MTNEEKAEEICRDYNYTQFLNDGTKDIYTESAVLYMLEKMAQWKDKVFEEKLKLILSSMEEKHIKDIICNKEIAIKEFKRKIQAL